MNKEDLEKRIKQDLMQKDKETIIDLYLQMKFERDIFDQQLAELKAELDAKETINQLYKSTLSLKDSDFSDLVRENTKLKQQLKEKDEEIETIKAFLNRTTFTKEVTKQVCEKIRKNSPHYFCNRKGAWNSHCYEIPAKLLDQIEKGENDE